MRWVHHLRGVALQSKVDLSGSGPPEPARQVRPAEDVCVRQALDCCRRHGTLAVLPWVPSFQGFRWFLRAFLSSGLARLTG